MEHDNNNISSLLLPDSFLINCHVILSEKLISIYIHFTISRRIILILNSLLRLQTSILVRS